MATEKDFVKRIVKEMVDYYLYHELYDVTAHVVYVPHEKATITCTAPYTKLPEDLDLLEAGLSVEKHLELDSMYSSLMDRIIVIKTIASLVNVLMITILK